MEQTLKLIELHLNMMVSLKFIEVKNYMSMAPSHFSKEQTKELRKLLEQYGDMLVERKQGGKEGGGVGQGTPLGDV